MMTFLLGGTHLWDVHREKIQHIPWGSYWGREFDEWLRVGSSGSEVLEGTRFGLVHQSGLVLSNETILSPTRQWWKNMWPRTMNFPSISRLGWSEKRCNGSWFPFVSSFLADYAVLFCYAPGVSDVFINSLWPTSTHRLSISPKRRQTCHR